MRHKQNPAAAGELGLRLRQLRRQQGLTQKELAARAGVAQTYISDLERGTGKIPSSTVIGRLAAALQVSVRQLTTISEDREPAIQPEVPDARLAELIRLWKDLRPADQDVLLYLARALGQQRARDRTADEGRGRDVQQDRVGECK